MHERISRMVALGAGCGLIGSITATAGATGPGDVDGRIAAMEAQIAQLRAEKGSWLDAERTRALIASAMEDSERRASLLRAEGSAGFRSGKGFFLSNEDGTFDMYLSGYSQFRAMYNDKDGADQSTGGFENNRTYLQVAGHAGSQDLTYVIQADFGSNGVFTLQNAYGQYQMGNGWSWSWGQVKDQFLRERINGDTTIQAVERSYVHALTNTGRTQGTWLTYEGDTIRGWLSFNDGDRVPSLSAPHTQNINTPFSADGTEWAVTARGEALLAGNGGWSQFNDYTSWSTDEFGALVGAAIRWQDGEYGTGAEETELFSWTADVQLEFGGANLAGWVVGQHSNPNATASPEYDQFGFVVQGGVHVVPDKFELFGRYEWFDFDNFASLDDLSIVTAGFNYYFRKHGWKWTTDVIIALDRVPTTVGSMALFADGPGEDDQIALRTQMQITIP